MNGNAQNAFLTQLSPNPFGSQEFLWLLPGVRLSLRGLHGRSLEMSVELQIAYLV